MPMPPMRAAWPLVFCLFLERLVPSETLILPNVPSENCKKIKNPSFSFNDRIDNVSLNSPHNRRSALIQTAKGASILSLLWTSPPATAASDEAFPPITHRVFMDVRISRADGTFYVRDDPPGTIPTPENQVFYGRLILGLFGTAAPSHVQRFLKYVNVTYIPGDDEFESPLPSYSRSVFKSLDQRTGLLVGGAIPGLEITSIGGSSALQYGTRIIPAQLWIDKTDHRISHSRGQLLTHRNFDLLPDFGITTRAAPELDGTHTVFGRLLTDESSTAFLGRVIDLPTYSMDRAYLDQDNEGGVIVDAASNLYTIQRDFFRQAAKTLGDSRLDKTFEGKLLRRVEVTQVGLMDV